MLYNRYKFILGLMILGACTKPVLQTGKIDVPETIIKNPAEPIVMVTKDATYTKTEFAIEFENLASLDSASNEDLIDEVLQKKLFILEAKSLGLDTTDHFEEEVETYKKIELQSFLEDKNAINALMDDAFKKYQTEINASHIFIPLSWYAFPADTISLYNNLVDLRKTALKKNNFEILAKEWSKDPKTANSGGSLGWFSTFHLILPLEDAAYNTSVDSISMPVRTKAGYHIIKVNDKRKNSGFVKVQQILKYLGKNQTKEQFDQSFHLLDSLHSVLKKGGNFDELTKKYSDDINSQQTLGVLPVFGMGTREESTFEEAAFNLKIGEVSSPIKSSNGLHLIKLLARYVPDEKEDFIKKNINKITTDSRADFLQKKHLEELKRRYNLKINLEIISHCLNFADDRILKREWETHNSDLDKFVIFTIDNQKYLAGNFFEYVRERQSFDKWSSEETPVHIFKMFFEKYLEKSLIEFEEKQYSKDENNLTRLLKAEKDNLLYSKFYNINIIQKSLDDTTGQRKFYDNNPQLFGLKELGTVSTISFKDSTIYQQFNKARNKAKPYQLYRGIKPIYYLKNHFEMGVDEKRKMIGLLAILKKNQGYIVEIGGHIDNNENENISASRIKQIVDFLVENGLPLTRILEVDYKSNKVQDKFDWTKNQRVSFQFFSNYESDLVKVFNSKESDAIVFKTMSVEKEEYENRTGLKWQNVTDVQKTGGRIEEISLNIKIHQKGYKDFKYQIIEKYQQYLKHTLEQQLIKKYQVSIDKIELNKLIEEVKSKNK
jgi:peptidyl-prolyl cis-trans isomerase SurA